MIDFEQIGRRILEERKYLLGISQEKMAEDLGMYQADISNLEKAKSGSGITDLAKLDMIADYFGMPLESLLFGRRQEQMEKYYGSKMQLKEFAKKRSRKHDSILQKLLGIQDPEEFKLASKHIHSFECGPYMIYVAHEFQMILGGGGTQSADPFVKAHLYVIYQDEVIGCVTAAITSLMQHIFQPAFEQLKMFIMPDTFELDDTLAVLNPYWLLHQYAVNEEEEEEFLHKLLPRMDQLRATGQSRIIFYVESAFVREDCRNNGIFRMMIDVLKKFGRNPMIWLSLEPTSGAELNSEYGYHPAYKASELGQINLNASIAERLGFTIDSKSEDKQAEQIEEDGSIVVNTIPVRRNAYYLPKEIKEIISEDTELLAYARAREKTLKVDEDPSVLDVYNGAWKEYGYILAIKLVEEHQTVFVFARGMDWDTRWLGVSKENPARTGEFVETIERYDSLEEAKQSKYYDGLKTAEQLLGSIYFGIHSSDEIDFDGLV